jgi:hypothetical protein
MLFTFFIRARCQDGLDGQAQRSPSSYALTPPSAGPHSQQTNADPISGHGVRSCSSGDDLPNGAEHV